jgi:hypothetical protein
MLNEPHREEQQDIVASVKSAEGLAIHPDFSEVL